MYIWIYGDVIFLVCWVTECLSFFLLCSLYCFPKDKLRFILGTALVAGMQLLIILCFRWKGLLLAVFLDGIIHILTYRWLQIVDKILSFKSIEILFSHTMILIGIGGLLSLGWKNQVTLGYFLVAFPLAVGLLGFLIYFFL